MINLNDHKFFEYQTKQEVVPLNIALQAVDEAYQDNQQMKEFQANMEKFQKNMNQVITGLNNIKLDD